MNSDILSRIDTKKLALTVSVISFGSIVAALISQHVFDMQPCAWCVLQRLIFIVIGIMSLSVCFFADNKKANVSLWGMISMLASVGEVVALYQLLVASKSFDCSITLAEKVISLTHLNELIPGLFGVFALCGDANPPILGIPYIFYSIVLFITISFVSSFGLIKAIKAMNHN